MTTTFCKNLIVNLTFCILLAVGAISIHAQTSAFTYQGRLTDNSMPPTGTYDFQFQLYNTLGSASGAAIIVEDVSVTNGIFTVELDFGAAAFQQVALTSRSIEIRVRPGTSTGAFAALAPRQAFTAAPIAIASIKSKTAFKVQGNWARVVYDDTDVNVILKKTGKAWKIVWDYNAAGEEGIDASDYLKGVPKGILSPFPQGMQQ